MSSTTSHPSIRADVDRGLEIRQQMETLKAELEIIEARLKAAGLEGEQVELKDADREGRQFLAAGTQRIVPVIFTADKLIGLVSSGTDKAKEIVAASHGKIDSFFQLVRGYKNRFDNGKKFRSLADELLGKVHGPAFITACIARDKQGIPKSDIKVCWDDAQVAAAERHH